MLLKLIVPFALLCGVVVSHPQQQRRRLVQRQYQEQQPELVEVERPKVYEVRHQISPNVGDGRFQYYSAFSNGLESNQAGHQNNPNAQVHQGSYTTMNEFGQVVRVDYIADKDGFRPIGSDGQSLLPTAPPVPEEHLRATAEILAQQKAIREEHLSYHRSGGIPPQGR